MRKSSICVLVSGGLDSDVLLADMARRYHRVYPLYIRQGLAWEDAELYWLRRFLGSVKKPAIVPLRVLSLPMNDLYENHWSVNRRSVPGRRTPDRAVYLPGRNLVLLVKSAVFCALHKVPKIALGRWGTIHFRMPAPAFLDCGQKPCGAGWAPRYRFRRRTGSSRRRR